MGIAERTKSAIGAWKPDGEEAGDVGGEARNQETEKGRQSGLLNQLVVIEIVSKPQKGGDGAVAWQRSR